MDEIYLGKTQKFLTVASNLESGEPLWFGHDRKQETMDEFFSTQLSAFQRKAHPSCLRGHVGAVHREHTEVGAAMPIVFDKFHAMQHAAKDIDEVRRAASVRKGGRMRDVALAAADARWVNPDDLKRQMLNELFRLNRRMLKA